MAEVVSVQDQLEQQVGALYPPGAESHMQLLEMGRTDPVAAWFSPAIARRDGSAIAGQGLIAVTEIPENMLVAIKPGHVIDSRTVNERADVLKGSQQQIGPDQFLAGIAMDSDPADEAAALEAVDKNLVGYNHSCNSNAEIVLVRGASLAFLVTRRLVKPGEELTTDYSVSQMTNTHFMICNCGSPACRGIIAPLWDWEDPDFQAQHSGEFPWYLRAAIDEQSQLSPQSEQTQREFHELLKTAGGLRLLDQAVKELQADREGRLARVLDEWRPAVLEDWQQTPEAARLQRYEELQMQAAGQFVALYPLLGSSDLEIEAGDFLPDAAIDHGEAVRTMHERIEPHLDEITTLAKDLAAEFEYDFER